MEMAISIAKWFLDDSIRLNSQLSVNTSQKNAAALLEWMKNLDQDDNDPLNAADLLRFGPLPIRKKKAREEALKSFLIMVGSRSEN